MDDRLSETAPCRETGHDHAACARRPSRRRTRPRGHGDRPFSCRDGSLRRRAACGVEQFECRRRPEHLQAVRLRRLPWLAGQKRDAAARPDAAGRSRQEMVASGARRVPQESVPCPAIQPHAEPAAQRSGASARRRQPARVAAGGPRRASRPHRLHRPGMARGRGETAVDRNARAPGEGGAVERLRCRAIGGQERRVRGATGRFSARTHDRDVSLLPVERRWQSPVHRRPTGRGKRRHPPRHGTPWGDRARSRSPSDPH